MSTRDPIAYFLDDIEGHGRNQRTVEAYSRVLHRFHAYLDAEHNKQPLDAEYRDCMAFIHQLRSEYAESTIASYASYLNRFYGYLVRVGEHDQNPMELVLEEMSESIDANPARRDISLVDMRQFLSDVTHPLQYAVMMTLAKTGIRSGELCNLDLVDINIAHPDIWWSPRAQIAEKPDSIYISSEHSYGHKSGGTVREASNKRQRDTTIPIDQELKETLFAWLSIRPDTRGAPAPLFCGTAEGWGDRLTLHQVHHMVESHARSYGWYRTGGGATENVTPHYFRHFFTTHLRDRTGDRGIVKYLRGDVANDVIETYTHDWNNRVRQQYIDHIYSLTRP